MTFPEENPLRDKFNLCALNRSGRQPRYYQEIAIRNVLEAVAKQRNRILLTMATGTGKTYTAFQIVYRLLKSGLKKKVLYLADRNILVDQSIQQDFSPLEKTIHKINFTKDDPVTITSHEVYFSLYQQLAGNNADEEDETSGEEAVDRFAQLFSKDFFDLICYHKQYIYPVINIERFSENSWLVRSCPLQM